MLVCSASADDAETLLHGKARRLYASDGRGARAPTSIAVWSSTACAMVPLYPNELTHAGHDAATPATCVGMTKHD